MKTRLVGAVCAGMILSISFSTPVNAATITNGFTFAVASDGLDNSVGNHFHSSTGGDFGNPAGKAEVGSFFSEEVRGLSEYNLTGLSNSSTAFVTFDVYLAGGLFPGANDFPFNGDIDVVAYVGNNLEDISDYQAPETAFIGNFSTAALSVGDILSFDVSSVFNDAIDASSPSLGIRLQIASGTDTGGGAWTFEDFRLTTDDQSTVVPIPAAVWLFGSGLLGLIGIARRKKAA